MKILLSGVSGSGKSFLSRALQMELGYSVVPSITTRPPRKNEQYWTDRIFCTEEDFVRTCNHKDVIFRKEVYGNWYAFDMRAVASDKCVFQLKYFYIQELRSLLDDSVTIYIAPANQSVAEDILIARTADSTEREERLLGLHSELADIDKIRKTFDHVWLNHYDDKSKYAFVDLVKSLDKEC